MGRSLEPSSGHCMFDIDGVCVRRTGRRAGGRAGGRPGGRPDGRAVGRSRGRAGWRSENMCEKKGHSRCSSRCTNISVRVSMMRKTTCFGIPAKTIFAKPQYCKRFNKFKIALHMFKGCMLSAFVHLQRARERSNINSGIYVHMATHH